AGLIEIFGDDRGAGNRGVAFLHKHRRGARRVENEEFLAPLPHPLLDRARGQAVLAERQPHEARVRAKGVVEQRQHRALRGRGLRRSCDANDYDEGFVTKAFGSAAAVKSGCAGPYGQTRPGATFPVAPRSMMRDKPAPSRPETHPVSLEPSMIFDLIKAFVLGVVEGLTEFLPVSSTGHLLLVQRFFGFDDDDFGKTFAVLIQFGAILALLSIYFFRIWQIAVGMFNDPAARR